MGCFTAFTDAAEHQLPVKVPVFSSVITAPSRKFFTAAALKTPCLCFPLCFHYCSFDVIFVSSVSTLQLDKIHIFGI